jgi:hypothetical protein
MKLIMENWRKWLGLEEDPPADGMKPIDPRSYDVHAGGASSQLPLLEPPDEVPVGAPIKDRPALAIDHPKGAPTFWTIDKLDRDQQDFKKSDRNFRDMEARGQTLEDLQNKWDVQNRELTWLEASDTITQYEADMHRERMEEFHEVLAHAQTTDINLFHLNKEINDIEGSIRALKTKV